jgi:DNA invertase Pin-like site-specific DNA recombinase
MDTTSPMGRFLFEISAALAQLERSRISERVKAGMENARAKGTKIGRPKVTERPAFIRKWPTVRAEVLAGTLSRRRAAKKLRIGFATLQRQLADEEVPHQKGVA